MVLWVSGMLGAALAWRTGTCGFRTAASAAAGLGATLAWISERRSRAWWSERRSLDAEWLADVVRLAGDAELPDGWELDELPDMVEEDDRARLLEVLERSPAGGTRLRAALAAIGAEG